MMTPFLTVAEVRLIEQQLVKIVNAKASSKDANILSTVRELALTTLREKLPLAENQETLLRAVETVEDRLDVTLFVENLQAYTIPFKAISEKGIEKLFKKDKKLKIPKLSEIDWKGISYLSWQDSGTHRQYIVIEREGNFTGLRGTIGNTNTKGVCAICNEHSNVHLFTAKVKGQADAYKSYSQYICDDADNCNRRLKDYEKLVQFVENNLN
ncbi:FusB/FusC family EF-G-binding protein [Bacillus ndiopicus]|uniref:FusB/FusC family EF-G-binding protein n=1 Tax=Bacillus ndiopicus TaxID=1347368 RepID=UPI0005A7FE4A|nr:elongation factor G-binding protein [Bacillus ndiopicus]